MITLKSLLFEVFGGGKTAGIGIDTEKFKDGSPFYIKFDVEDLISKTAHLPIQNIPISDIHYNFAGRQEDPNKTKDRVQKSDLKYPIIVVKNEHGKIFSVLDGTHRLQKAIEQGDKKINAKIVDKEDLYQYKVSNV